MTGYDSNAFYDANSRRGFRADQEHDEVDETSFQHLVEHSPDGILVHRDGRVVYANATAMRWIGAQYPDQVCGHVITEFLHPDSVEPLLKRIALLRNDGDATGAAEGALVRFDGTTLNVEGVTALTTWGGQPAYHVTLRDLTSIRSTQRSLRQQAALVDGVGVAIISTTVTGLVTTWNRAAETIYRRPAADALSLPVGVAVGGRLDPNAVIAAGGVVHVTHHTADGQPIYVRVSVSALDTGFALVCTDKTESHLAERLLRRIVNSLHEGILVIDGAGGVVSVNPSAEEILGLSATTLTGGDGRTVHGLPMYDAERRRIPAHDTPIAEIVRTGRPFQGVVVGIDRADGQRIWLRVGGRRLDGDYGWGVATLVSFSDVTAERVAQERLTYRATHDALTGLPNRAAVLNEISESLRAQGDQRLGAVLFIDLDNLKAINDSLGHDTGDELLQSVANCLRTSVVHHDVVGRLGGDEFVILVTGDVGHSHLASLIARLEENLSQPMTLGAATLRTHASIGVTMVGPDDVRSAFEILRDADAAMYETKARRRRSTDPSGGTSQRTAGPTAFGHPAGGTGRATRQSFRFPDGRFGAGGPRPR